MINKNYTKEKLLELYKKTPKDIQGILLDKNLGPAISVIGKDAGLTALQSLEIEDSVVDVLLGVNKQKNLTQDITNKLNIKSETALKITNDINENIFSQVKESLTKIKEGDKDTVLEKDKAVVQKKIVIKTEVPLSVSPAVVGISEERKKIAIKELSKPIPTPVSLQRTAPQPITKQIFLKEKGVQLQPTSTTPLKENREGIISTQTIPKTIVGEEKIGIGIPSKEHQFEEKLRGAFEAPKKEAEKPNPTISTPPQKITQDPYREPLK